MQIKDAQKVLDVSRTTMMAWIDEGRFPNARKEDDNIRAPWLIPVEEVEKVRLELISDLHEQLARISRPATDYAANGHLVAKVN